MPKPISTAPKDGRKITVHWTDRDGVENTSIAQYRSPERLKALGDEDPSDAGWWAYVDGDTQKRIEPHSWSDQAEEESEE